MGWIAIVIICAVLLFLILNLSSSRRGKKSASRQTIAVPPPKKSSEGMEDSKVEAIKSRQEGRQRVSRETSTYGRGGEVPGTYITRHDWQKLWKESLKTLFLDELSPAQPYLRKAYELEKEGADPKKIHEVLEKAYQLDKRATDFYRGRISIVKEAWSKSHQNRGQP